MKPAIVQAMKMSIENETCNCASLAQVRKAGEGDSFRS